jgi:hypothetical protein
MKNKKQESLKQDIHSAVLETLALLQKSSDLQKEDESMDGNEESAAMPEVAAEEGAENAQPEEMPEEAPEAEAEGEEESSLQDHLASMEDEELHELVDAAIAELESRMGAGAEQEPAAEENPSNNMEPNPMAEQMENMQKSIAALTDMVSRQSEELKKSVKAPAPKVANSKPIPSNRVEVLSKSVEKPQRLNKSETAEFLLNQQRKGNSIVNSQILAKANSVKNEEDLHMLQDQLTKAGLAFPKL